MAVYKTSNAVSEKESVSSVIERIDPETTPLFSNAKKEVVKGILHEFQVQELASVSATNYQNEGSTYSYVNVQPTTRLSNVCQISINAGSISGSLDAVDNHGIQRHTAYAKLLKGIEQRRDIEKYLFSNTAKSTSDPRKTASLITWITNADFSTSGSTSAVATGDGSDTATLTGTDRALSLALIDNAMKLAYDDGGQPDILLLSPANKVAFSDLSSGSVVTNQLHMTAPKEMSIIGSASIYLTDFGEVSAVIDRYANDSEIYLLDSNHYSIGHLPNRLFKQEDVAPVGDASQFSILSEWCLIVKAPKAHGAVFDLST